MFTLNKFLAKKNSFVYKPKKFLTYSTNLLEKLAKKEHFNTIVLNFFPSNQGYSLGFNIKSDQLGVNANDLMSLNNIETKMLPYDETELLFYINAGEIPPILIDLIDRLNVCISDFLKIF